MAKKTLNQTGSLNGEPMQDEISYTTAAASKTKRSTTKRTGAGRNETSCPDHAVKGGKPTSAKTKRTGQKQGHELDYTTTPRSDQTDRPGLGQDGPGCSEPNRAAIRFDALPQSAREMLNKQSAAYAERDNARKVPAKPRNSNEQLSLAANEGPTADILEASIEVFNLPKIDIHDEQQVSQRLSEFFSIYARRGLKPTVVSMGMALGLDRRRLWEIKSGAKSTNDSVRLMPPEVRGRIKAAYDIMESLWESYMLAGKINPVTGIFLAKNNWGYVDRMDHVVAPGTEEQTRSAEEIRNRYLNSADEIDTEFE